MHVNANLSCCGLREVVGVDAYQTPEVFFKDLFGVRGYHRPADGLARRPFVILTSVVGFGRSLKRYTRGEDLVTYIEANKLGSVVRCGEARNPGSGNVLAMYVWRPNYRSLAAHEKKLRKAHSKQVA